jgi:glycosyltransferase involved in cell wall biosynthesis
MPGSPRLFSLCRVLARHHRLSLVAPCSSAERGQAFADDPAAAGVFQNMTILAAPPVSGWWHRQHHRLRLAPFFVTKYRTPDYYRTVVGVVEKQLTAGKPADLVYVDGIAMMQYAPATRTVPIVVDLHDSHTLLVERLFRMERGLSRRKIGLFFEKQSVARWERSLGSRCELIITNSPVDESVVRQAAPAGRTMTITNGVDAEYFAPGADPWDPDKLVFTGVMNYGPNEDAAAYFCEAILPAIRRRLPDIQFWVVGADPSPRIRALGREPGVHVTGRVDDIRPYVQSAGAFVCPLRYGAGMKNKILAAMAMRKPVVATSISLEGIEARAGEHVLVADRPEDFGARIVDLLADRELARRLGDGGHRLVAERYSWGARGEALEAALREIVSGSRAGAAPASAPSP